MNRRSFIKLFALSGVAAASGVAVAKRESIETLMHDGAYRVSQSKNAIGTHVDITAIGPSSMKTEDAVQAAFDDVAQMEQLLTRFGNQSPVSELNAEGHVDHIAPQIAGLYRACQYFFYDTDGAFDVTVKPLVDLFEKAGRENRRPQASEIAQIAPLIGTTKIQFNNERLALNEGMGITFDGAAPGFIADRCAQILRDYGIEDFLVNAGGEIRTSGHPKDAKAWRVAIQDPAKQGNFPGFLEMTNAAVSTSGNYEIYYGQDRVFHHIVDGRTGYSPKRTSVTVTAPSALEADILSTALFVMSPEEALAYIAKRPQYACLIIENDGRRIMSPNFKMA